MRRRRAKRRPASSPRASADHDEPHRASPLWKWPRQAYSRNSLKRSQSRPSGVPSQLWRGLVMRRKALASLGLIALLAAGLAAAGVIPGIAGTIGTTTQSSGLTTGGPKADFTYEGQTISHTT